MWILILNIRQSHDRFIFIIWIPLPGKTVFILRRDAGDRKVARRGISCNHRGVADVADDPALVKSRNIPDFRFQSMPCSRHASLSIGYGNGQNYREEV